MSDGKPRNSLGDSSTLLLAGVAMSLCFTVVAIAVASQFLDLVPSVLVGLAAGVVMILAHWKIMRRPSP